MTVSQAEVDALAQKIAAELGELRHIHRWEPEEVLKYIAYSVPSCDQRLVESVFSKCGLKPSDAMFGFATLTMHSPWLEFHGDDSNRRFMPRAKREEYGVWLQQQKGQEPEPEKEKVSDTLQAHASDIADPNEKTFYEETLLCLRANAYRSAIVMGWNLAYGHLTHWVYTDPRRLQQFNNELTNRWVNKQRNIRYAAVIDEDDFGNAKESIVIEVCRKCGLVSKEDYEILDSALRKRNTFAHPTKAARVDAPIAAGHVSELVNFMNTLQ